MKRLTLGLLGLWIVILAVPSAAQKSEKYSKNWSLTGEVTAINTRLKTVDVRARDGARYIVEVDFADISVPGKSKAKIGDIPMRSQVRVSGRLLPNRIVEGERIEIEERSAGPERDRDQVEEERDRILKDRDAVSGKVASLDTRKHEMKVQTSQGLVTVVANSRTKILAEGLTIEFREIPLGSQVFVAGKPEQRNRVRAERIVIGDKQEPSSRTLKGEIARMRDREWVILTDSGEETLRLESGTELTLDGRKVSVDDIFEGDQVIARGEIKNGKFTAQSIQVIPSPQRARAEIEEKTPPSKEDGEEPDIRPEPEKPEEPDKGSESPKPSKARQETIEGTVAEIFNDDRSFRLRSGNRTITVDASMADILRDDKDVEFSDVRENNKVKVIGWMDGDILEATEIVLL